MKTIQRILSLLLCAALLTALLASCALAEDTVYTTFHLDLHRNKVFAKYGVTIRLDGQVIGHMDQGDQVSFGGALTADQPHVISLVPDKASVATCFIIVNNLSSGAMVTATVQTHVLSVTVEDKTASHCTLITAQ